MKIWCCGDHRIWLIDPEKRAKNGVCAIEEEVDFNTLDGIDADQRRGFCRTDDVKPIAPAGKSTQGYDLLVTSSGSMAGVLEKDAANQWRVRWMYPATNAHSAAALGDGLYAVASSDGGDELILLKEEHGKIEKRAAMAFPHAHGVVLDRSRNCVWAVGASTLVKLAIPVDSKHVAWQVIQELTVPGRGAHDLSSLPDGMYAISVHQGVWRFDPDSGQFSEFEELGQRPHVKSINVNSIYGRIYTQADTNEPNAWWTYRAHWRAVGAAEDIPLRVADDRILYKVRWEEIW